jgi:colanic acid biosynthesis glycosyl transferase WcaI
MRILLLSLNFAPEMTGVGRYTGEMAAWLADQGHHVSVITTRPFFPEWKKAPAPQRWTWRSESWHGCRVLRCPVYVPPRMSGMQRLLHVGSFAASCIPAAALELLRGKVDVVAAIEPSLVAAPVALVLARLLGAKSWLHVQDLEIDLAIDLGMIRNRRLIDGAVRFELELLRRFDLVSAISEKMVEAIARKGVARDRLMLFPNWVDTHHIFPLPAPVPLRHDLGIAEACCVALYAGSMGQKQGLEFVIAAARKLSDVPSNSLLFVLAGDGPVRAALEERGRDLPNVRFLPLQPEARLNELLNMADIHLLPQRADATDLVMPSKLGGMLASGKPVIATVAPGTQIALTLGDAGVLVPPEDAPMLAQAIRVLAGDGARRARMGSLALEIARRRFEASTILGTAAARLDALICGKGGRGALVDL